MKVMPNQLIAHRTPAEAWKWALSLIDRYGDLIRTEDNQMCREIRNLQLTIMEPGEGWPIPGSAWSSLKALDIYAETEILSPIIPDGFRYSYGERLFAYPPIFMDEWIDPINQIKMVITRLKVNPTTRRAMAPTWQPFEDHNKDSVPCLQLVDFLFRDGKLHLSATFRSWDVRQAAPANMYGLWKLLCYVGQEAGMEPGSLTIMAVSAHVYEL